MNIKVFRELLIERDQNDPLLDHIIICIYGLLKKHILTLVEANINQKGVYNDIKNLILEIVNNRYIKLDNPSYIMRNYICDCISILIISGITSSWTTCIQDLINETNSGNPEMIFIVLRSIADCDSIMNFYENENDDFYWDDNLQFQQNEKKEIKKKLIENQPLIFDFIGKVYSNVDKFEKKLKNRIIKSIIGLITFWTKLNLNILINHNLYINIMDLIDTIEEEKDKIENLKSMAELINISNLNSKNCKLYEFYEKLEGDISPEQVLQDIFNNVDRNEKEGIEGYLNYIIKKINEFNKTKNNNENILWIYGKILSSFLENYIYLFFDFSNKINETIFELLKFFISHKKRKISWMFFSSIESMMNFITDYYRFYGVNENIKNNFSNYLITMLINVMENCAFKKLNPNDFSQLKNIILYKDAESNWEIKDKNELYNNMGEDDFDIDDIDIKEYRNSAENVFYCIYLIFKEGLNQEINFINNILFSLININDNEIKNSIDTNNAIKLDIVLLVLKSIIPGVDKQKTSDIAKIINEYIYNLSDCIFIHQVNTTIFVDYLLIINIIGDFLVKDKKYFEKVIFILLEVSGMNGVNSYIIESCYKIMSNICEKITEDINYEKMFQEFFERFKTIYNIYNIKNIEPLENLINSMFYLIGINRYDEIEPGNNKNNHLIPFIQCILEYIYNELHLLFEKKNEMNVIDLKAGIIKVFLLYKNVFHNIHFANSDLRKSINGNFFPKSIDDLITIFKFFDNDIEIFIPIINFYISNAKEISEDCLNNFPNINNVFLQLFESNQNYFKITDFLETLYSHVLKNLKKEDKNYLESNKYLLDNFFILVKYSISSIKCESSLNNQLLAKINLLTYTINDVFPLLYIYVDQSENTKNMISEIIEILNFLINIIDSILIKKENEHLLADNFISFNINSIASLLNENIIKCFLINLSNEQIVQLVIQIVNKTWSLLNSKKFNSLSCNALSELYFQIIFFNVEIFCKVFSECLSKFFNKDYTNNIIEFIIFFHKDKNRVVEILKEILLICYDERNSDSLEFYFNQLKRKKNSK